MMPRLILIKHASPEVVPTVPSEQWRLSERGRASCGPLAEALRAHAPRVVVSSEEPKAVETAELVAKHLSIPHETAADLYEHDRRDVPHMRSGEFISMIELFFRRPDELVLGAETANEARARFAAAIDEVMTRHPQGDVAVVSHGTVIALFLEQHGSGPGFRAWREMGLPSFAVFDLPGLVLRETVAKIG